MKFNKLYQVVEKDNHDNTERVIFTELSKSAARKRMHEYEKHFDAKQKMYFVYIKEVERLFN